MIDRKALEIRKRKGLRMCGMWFRDKAAITPKRIGRAGTTRVPCSCWMCGNPRRHFRGKWALTLAELRELQRREEAAQEMESWMRAGHDCRGAGGVA